MNKRSSAPSKFGAEFGIRGSTALALLIIRKLVDDPFRVSHDAMAIGEVIENLPIVRFGLADDLPDAASHECPHQ